MVNKSPAKATDEKRSHTSFFPHVLVSILVVIVFVLAVGLSLLIPSLSLIYLVDWVEFSGFGLDSGWVVGLWVLSTLVSMAGYFIIQQTFVGRVLNRHVGSKLPDTINDE